MSLLKRNSDKQCDKNILESVLPFDTEYNYKIIKIDKTN